MVHSTINQPSGKAVSCRQPGAKQVFTSFDRFLGKSREQNFDEQWLTNKKSC